MEWSPEQDRALSAVSRWLRDEDSQIFRLFGYAGTGKTTLAKHFAEGVNGTVRFAAFTGKAAHVLRSKGCPGASTIHSLIYHSRDRGQARLKEMEAELAETCMLLTAEPDAQTLSPAEREAYISRNLKVKSLRQFIEAERSSLAKPMFTLNPESAVKDSELVVIDECSMVDGQMGQDLLSFGTKILVLGDPAQLPPVAGSGFFTESKPDFMLTEIHRQAAENPIIAMATRVRNREPLELGNYGDSRIVEKVTASEARSYDQILVGRNATRRDKNAKVRQLRGAQGPLPEEGERIVCLRNNNERQLLNGATYDVVAAGDVDDDKISLTIRGTEGGDELDVRAWTEFFTHAEPSIPWTLLKEAEQFDFGYAMTVHKSQGSQWDNVLLYDESSVFRKESHRWLYTGITRAAEKLTIVRPSYEDL